jgi:hypothetical protein
MKKFFLLPLAVLSLVTFNSCKKDDETEVDNKKPSVTITSPTGDIYVANETNNPINFTVNASDEDGSISKVQFYKNGIKVGPDDVSEPYSVSLNVDVASNVVFKAVATDNDGDKTEKTITVDVIQAP